MDISIELHNDLLVWQKAEITGHHIYSRLASMVGNEANRKVIERIAQDELGHYDVFRSFTEKDVEPDRFKILLFPWIARLFGLTFGIKLMERSEDAAQAAYAGLIKDIPQLEDVLKDEEEHETDLIDMLDEPLLRYIGSVVLGLNDALVELTGALAGLSLAFQNTNLIALSGLITGISASLSMAASEYLSQRAEGKGSDALRSAVYTGIAYIFTVAVLVLPYLLFSNYLICLVVTLTAAIVVIAVFNYYLAVARDLDFRRRFVEMTLISLGVAALSFGIGYLIRAWIGIDI